jgi:hypothetical protein
VGAIRSPSRARWREPLTFRGCEAPESSYWLRESDIDCCFDRCHGHRALAGGPIDYVASVDPGDMKDDYVATWIVNDAPRITSIRALAFQFPIPEVAAERFKATDLTAFVIRPVSSR